MAKFVAGLEDVIALESSICLVDGTHGKLYYRGYSIEELAAHSTFEETAYLLWFGELPTSFQLKDVEDSLLDNREFPGEVLDIIRDFPPTATPMEVLRTVVSALSSFDRNACYFSREADLCKTMRLTAQIPVAVAAHHRIRSGLPVMTPRAELGHAANFLYMLQGIEPDAVSARAFDVALVLHADHELNASTFAARVSAGTLADMYSSITSAIGTLAGPLHGGANQQVMQMLEEIGDMARVEEYVDRTLKEKKRVMGFGHRVYDTTDPRAEVLRQLSQEVGASKGDLRWFEISEKIRETVWRKKQLYPNVDFYSASLYHVLGIPHDLFTPVFAISRIAGWTAHVLEQYANNRLIRPRAEYVGPRNRQYVPIDDRGEYPVLPELRDQESPQEGTQTQ
ncbi:MAG: citrate synthase [Chloroflexota bacterium]|nr:MAG: citrate synthase [Chloroflexota bacterium]